MSKDHQDQPKDGQDFSSSSDHPLAPGQLIEKSGSKKRLGAVVALGSAWRLGLCFWHLPTSFLFSDPKRHWLNGQRLFAPDLMGASDPLLYQIYLFVLQHLTAGNVYVVAFACGLLSVGTAWAFYGAARELGDQRRISARNLP